MQQLKLANDLFPGVVNNTKHMTIRKGRRDIQLGWLEIETTDPVQGSFLNHAVRVHRVVYTMVGMLCDRDAKEDGFDSVQDLIDKMQRFYPGLDAGTEITLVYWS